MDHLETYKVFLLQSWYFGYVLAVVFVICAVFLFSIFKHKGIHCIAWVPTLLMMLCCLAVCSIDAVKITDKLPIQSIESLAVNDSDTIRRLAAEVILNSVEQWKNAAWKYILATLVFSVIAACAYRKLKDRPMVMSGICIAMLSLLIALCAVDRVAAVSARLYWELNDLAKEDTTGAYQIEVEGETYLGLTFTDFNSVGYEHKNSYVLAENIPVFSQPYRSSEKVCTINTGKNISVSELMLFLLADRPGWRLSFSIYPGTAHYDENGWPNYRYEGYMNIEDILTACRGRRISAMGIIARHKLMEVDMKMFESGYAVSPSIMYAFEPFEIYLLAPLTVIFGITWLVLLIRSRIVKCKASTT